jgi:indolepyruvate ferredoxin oxidoreductase
MMRAFRLLAQFKGLRGTALDIFGRTEERRTERALITEYAATVEQLLAKLTPANHALAVEIASVPEMIRGYGHVKMRHLKQAEKQRAELLGKFSAPVERTARAA